MPVPVFRSLSLAAFSLVAFTQVAFAQDWMQVNLGSTQPQARPDVNNGVGLVMVYDETRQEVMGFDSGPFGATPQTWIWDGSAWALRGTVNSPAALIGASMCYDAAAQETVLFGGLNPPSTSQETWLWDGSNWVNANLSPAASPPGTVEASLAYAGGGKSILFGGFANADRTWEWDGTSWTERFSAMKPSARRGSQMCYAGNGRVVLFGGQAGGAEVGDTWEWDGTTWTLIPPGPSDPPARHRGNIVFDSARNRCVLFGGTSSASGELNDTWSYSSSSGWTQITPLTTVPPTISSQGQAYDALNDQVVVVPSSFVGPTLIGTWVLGGVPVQASEFSSGDAGVGVAPCDVIAKDLSGDGLPDIATADSGADTVTVLVNDGSGGFGGAPTTVALAVGSTPSALAAGNLIAGEGCDVAVAAKDGDAVIVLDNSPAGAFAVSSTLTTLPATEPVSVDVGDIDGSGTDDIVVAMQGDLLIPGTGGVSISLNGGALVGLVAPPLGFLRPQNAVLCDLDGDEDNDIVVTVMGSTFAPTVTDNILLYENVAGVFGTPIALSVSQNPRGLCCGDIDGDGDADIAVTAESFPFLVPGSVEVFDNTGLTPGAWVIGVFVGGGSFAGGSSPMDIACADLRDDGIPGFCTLEDIVTVNFGSEDLTWNDNYDAAGDVFADQRSLSAGSVPVALVIADVNGDKTPDIVVANKASDNVTIHTSTEVAQAKVFGTGCAGTGGLIPQISSVGLPTYANPAFGVSLSNARPSAPTLFGVSLGQATTTLGGCELYLTPPLVLLAKITDGAGNANVDLVIPGALAGFVGCDVFFQYFVFDSNGSYLSQFAFSDGLRIKMGN